MNSYVLGFVFNRYDEVLLMTKSHPPLQKGRLNGIGGSIEDSPLRPGERETPMEAMIRESAEEVATEVPITWQEVGKFHGPNYEIFVFSASFRLPIAAKEQEPVAWYNIRYLPEHCMYNLKWLVPLCSFSQWQIYSHVNHLKFDILNG